MLCRRPAPTIFAATIAAAVVILPWATANSPGGGDDPRADDTLLAAQPLTGLSGGVTIREVTQDTPFSMVALTGEDLTGTSARVRAKRADGSWGPWYDAETIETVVSADSTADDATSPGMSPGMSPGTSRGTSRGTRGTDPVFVGTTTSVQIAVTRPAGAAATPPMAEPPSSTPTKPGLGYIPATTEQPFTQNISAVLITPPQAPVDSQWTPPAAITAPGQAPNIITRAQWGAGASQRCGNPVYDNGVKAVVVHHTAGSNDYSPQDSPAIMQAAYAYHTRMLGWCDIAYNAVVDKYGQVFEGRAGGITKPVVGAHTGGFNRNTWGVAMIGDFEDAPPPPVQLRTVGRLIGWRLAMDRVDSHGTVTLTSAGSRFTHFPRGTTPTLPTIFTHRDVGNTECPGDAAYAAMDHIRDIASRFNNPPGPEDLAASLEGGAIWAQWQGMGGMTSVLGAPTSPEAAAAASARYATFDKGAVYWSPNTGAEPVTGAIYEAWASLGYERGALGLPTSKEIQEPQWIVQNFQHGTLNFDRQNSTVTRVIDGVAQQLPPPSPSGPPVQLERFSRPINPADAA